MDEKDLEAIGGLLDKKLSKNLEPIKETLDAHTASLVKLENTIGVYSDALDVERKRIDSHEERLEVVEKRLGSNV